MSTYFKKFKEIQKKINKKNLIQREKNEILDIVMKASLADNMGVLSACLLPRLIVLFECLAWHLGIK